MHYLSKNLLVAFVSAGLFACAGTNEANVSHSATNTVAPTAIIEPVQTSSLTLSPDPEGKEIALKQIMSDPDWLGRQPFSSYWGDDSNSIFYKRKQAGSPVSDLWQRPLNQNGNGQKVSLKQIHEHAYQNRIISPYSSKSAWLFEGNLFVKNLDSNIISQLTRNAAKPSNLKFLIDGRLSYQQGNRIFAMTLNNGFTELLVSWKFAEPPKAVPKLKDYIAKQQIQLIEVVAKKRKERNTRFEQKLRLQNQNITLTPEPFYLPKKHETVEVSISPDGQKLLIVEKKTQARRDDKDIMPNYIGDDGRIKAEEVRQRVADSKSQNHALWLINIAQHSQHKLSYQNLPGYNDDVLAKVKKENAQAVGKDYQTNRLPRDIMLMQDRGWTKRAIKWHKNSNQLAVLLEAWDNKDRWLATVDFNDNKLVNQHRLHDDAWVNYRFNSFAWLNDSETLYYLSEESGYAHLYSKSLNGQAQALTSGQYEVDQLTLTNDDKFIYFKANKKHPGIYEIYRVNVITAELEALTDLNGMTDYQLSPDQNQLLLTHSKLTLPPELYLQPAQANAEVTRLTNTVSDEFLAIPWIAPHIVPVKSSNTEKAIFARVYQPNIEDDGVKRRAVMFSHGAGYLQNSHLGWSGYFREFMFHNMLVQQGYVVMDMDYRASAGYGRDWRTAIYRHMGKPEIEDLRDGVNWLVDNANVDRQRIGTYGGSYGGFMTFMAMFKEPDLFQAGAALRPVSDWAHYNHGYTSNILNTPDVDPIAYERSSPIYFAEGLQKPLLINAPMVDSNVFFVDVVRLVQRLIELEKEDFETAIYPVESHGFVQPSSWLDEYRRIYKLFETNL
ncbi:MAG: dipeptidyl aminopeptidase/acylaminoacyl peptidase [Paraglaciecola sp.]|jgi:dipeptidyl aminopeptidase/acylaminoacyl peptidase